MDKNHIFEHFFVPTYFISIYWKLRWHLRRCFIGYNICCNGLIFILLATILTNLCSGPVYFCAKVYFGKRRNTLSATDETKTIINNEQPYG